MPVSYAAGVSFISSSAIDGTEAVPVYVSACIAQAEIAGLAGCKATDPTFTPCVITGISQAASGVVTFTGTAPQIGDRVYIGGVVGMTQVNARSYIVNSVAGQTITLKTYRATPGGTYYNTYDLVVTTGYTAYTSGGTIYKLMRSCTATNLEFRVGRAPSAFLMFDREMVTITRGTARINPQGESSATANDGGYVVLGYHSTVSVETNVSRTDASGWACNTGGGFIAMRAPTGQNPQIIHIAGATRNDWPTLTSGMSPGEFIVEGLTKIQYGDSQKWYVGASRNKSGRDKLENLFLGGSSGDMFQVSGGIAGNTSTYVAPVVAQLAIGGDNPVTNIEVIAGQFGAENTSPSGFSWATLRGGRNWLTNCLFNNWSGAVTQSAGSAGSYGGFRYTNKITTKVGSTALAGAIVRRRRAVRGTVIGYDLAHASIAFGPEDADRYQSTDGSGAATSTCVGNFIGVSVGGLIGAQAREEYQYTCQIRSYLYDTAGEYVYENRVYGFGGTLGPVTEEVQMLTANAVTLSQVVASGLTGLSLVASVPTGGTITLTSDHTLAEVWCFWRNFQSTQGNQDSLRTWTFDGINLDVGGWSLVLDNAALHGPASGTLTLAGAATYIGTGNATVVVTDVTGSTGIWSISGILPGSSVAFYDNSGTRQSYTPSSGTVAVATIPSGATGSWTAHVRLYGYFPIVLTMPVSGGGYLSSLTFQLPDPKITQPLVAAVAAYTQLTTLGQRYDYANYWGTTSVGIDVIPVMVSAGTTLDMGFLALTRDATALSVWSYSSGALTIKAPTSDADANFTECVTTSTDVGTNGAVSTHVYTELGLRHVPLRVVNAQWTPTGFTRLRLYDMAQSLEVVSILMSGPTYFQYYTYTGSAPFNCRVKFVDGFDANTDYEATLNLPPTGLDFDVQGGTDDAVYIANAVDGFDVPEFFANGSSLEVNVTDSDNTTQVARVYAWMSAYQTTADGIRTFWNAIYAKDTANYVVDVAQVNLKFRNMKTALLVVSGGTLRRSDGSVDLVSADTVGSIYFDSGDAPAIQVRANLAPELALINANLDAPVSTRATQTSVNAIPVNPLLTTDARLVNLDAPVSLCATQASVNAIPVNTLLTNDARLSYLDASIASRSTLTAAGVWSYVLRSLTVGGGLTQQQVRDALTLPPTRVPEPGSIDTAIASVPAATLDTPNGLEAGITVRQGLKAIASVTCGQASVVAGAFTYYAIGSGGVTPRVSGNAQASGVRYNITFAW